MRKDHDLFQMDPALGYGLGEFARMVAAMETAGYSRAQLFPHGGHMIALHIVVGLGLGGSEAYPGVFAPVGGYAPDCTLEDGGIAPGPLPGFGLEAKPDLAPHIAALVRVKHVPAKYQASCLFRSRSGTACSTPRRRPG